MEMPPMPELPPMPTPTYIAPKDYREEEIQAENEAKIKKRNQLRAGRESTISTSPLGVEEAAPIKKVQLLGG
jgi:hypothetical protein